MNQTLKGIGIWTAKIVVTVLFLAYILRTVPLPLVVQALRGANISYVLLALAALLVSRVLMGCRMKQITNHQGMSLTVPQLVGISLTSTFYGTFLPGSLGGGLIRWYRLSRQDRKPGAALAAIAFDRLLDTSASTVLGLVCWLLSVSGRSRLPVGMVLLASFLVCAAVFWLAFHAKISVKKVKKLNSLLEAAQNYRTFPKRSLASVFSLSLAIQLTGTVSFAFAAQALDIQLPFADFAWIRTFAILAAMLPITVAGLGVREGVALALMGPYGIDPAQIVAFSVVRLANSLVIAGLGGLVELKEAFSPNRIHAPSAVEYKAVVR